MTKPYTDFDLPKQHLSNGRHYIPPRARSSCEIERRRAQPAGTLLIEQELQGIRIASVILHRIHERPDIHFASDILSAAGINSAWYSIAQNSEVMRRRLKLPILTVGAEKSPIPGSYSLLDKAQYQYDAAGVAAYRLLRAIRDRAPRQEERRMIAGRTLGNAALSLSCVTLGESSNPYTAYTKQALARQQSLKMLDLARNLEEHIGMPPSLAQLANPDSELSVYVRRTAPDGVYQAYEEATAIYPPDL